MNEAQYQELTRRIELLNFQLTLQNRKMTMTIVLILMMVGVMGIEEWRGGSTNIMTLVTMGANVGQMVKKGDYFRLFSSVFLHAGFLHLFFNCYVLYALGGFFNRILGNLQFLFIFLISGLSGSLASTFIGQSKVSVGSSGAIWGLFGASIILAFLPNKLLPLEVRLSLRKTTLINLLINMGVSLLPMVDMWAHFGGGLGGIVATGMIVIEPRHLVGKIIKKSVLWLVVGVLIVFYALSFRSILF